jgi:ABC-type sugar transport system substrate-binding protein
VLNAATELGKEGQIVIIGYDSGKQQKDAIRSGVSRPARSRRTRSASATSASRPR